MGGAAKIGEEGKGGEGKRAPGTRLPQKRYQKIWTLRIWWLRPGAARVRPPPALHVFQPSLCTHRHRPQETWSDKGRGHGACRPCTAGAAKEAATMVLELVRKVNRGSTPYQRHRLPPWHKPWAREVVWYGLVPHVTAWARAHGNNRTAAAMRPRIATKVAVIEPTPQSCLSRCGVDAITKVNNMTKPG